MGYRELVNRLNRQHPESRMLADGFLLMETTVNGQPCLFIILSLQGGNVVFPLTLSQASAMLGTLDQFVSEQGK